MTVHEQVIQNMTEMADRFAAAGVKLTMPPQSNITLGTTYTAIDLGKMLEAQIRFDGRFTNPLQMFQGGFLCAALDEVFGPLTFMAAGRPVLTIEMSTSYLRPFTAKDEAIIVRAEVVAKTKTLIVMKAEVKTISGKLVATATNHSLITNDDHLRRRS